MNAKTVLSKIASMISFNEVEVEFTDAKTADGTILQSPTFDVGEDVEVVAEDGTKSKAPNGEHQISLRDSEGNETLIRIITEDGKIVERENVEMAEVSVEVEPTEEEVVSEEAPKDEVDMGKKMDELTYRIEEMEKKMMEMEKAKPEVEKEMEMQDEELPKLDGAPIDDAVRFAVETNKKNFGQKSQNIQSSIYEKLYR
jgi:phosphatidate phosphatase PAH1